MAMFSTGFEMAFNKVCGDPMSVWRSHLRCSGQIVS
jgi:hypothetical protein